jgi:hypothetical protein
MDDVKRYLVEWDKRLYGEIEPEVFKLSDFTDDMGWTEKREAVSKLAVGESTGSLDDMYGTKVTRLTDAFKQGGELMREIEPPFIVWNLEDNIQATPKEFKTILEAEHFVEEFRDKFRAQGYYKNNRWEKIDPDDIEIGIFEKKDLTERGFMKQGGQTKYEEMWKTGVNYANEENEAVANFLLHTPDGNEILNKAKTASELEREVRSYHNKFGIPNWQFDDDSDGGIDWVTWGDLIEETSAQMKKGGRTPEHNQKLDMKYQSKEEWEKNRKRKRPAEPHPRQMKHGGMTGYIVTIHKGSEQYPYSFDTKEKAEAFKKAMQGDKDVKVTMRIQAPYPTKMSEIAFKNGGSVPTHNQKLDMLYQSRS